MQPYLFPYIGYFQLINAVDRFVIYDDVQWIKGGWINRNRILVSGEARYITVPVAKAPSNLPINERRLSEHFNDHRDKMLRTITGAYQKAPFFKPVSLLVEDCLSTGTDLVSDLVTGALRKICTYLDLRTPFVMSSSLDKDDSLRGEERVLAINELLGATHYINPIGGTALYNERTFSEHGLKLSFLKTRDIQYAQYRTREFVPLLSIIDILMFNSVDRIRVFLDEYDLLPAP